MTKDDDDLLPMKMVRSRYNVTSRTVERWLVAKLLPPPTLRIGDRRYWSRRTLEAFERERIGKSSTAA